MIDFIKYFVNDKDLFLQNSENSNILDLKGRFNFATGQITDFPKTAYHNNMNIKITENKACIGGSVHKFYNILEGYGDQNYNDFSFCDFQYCIERVENSFKINREETLLTNLEFGINIDVEQDPQSLIDNHILMYKNKPPNRNEKFYGKGDYLEFQMSDYSIKIYNKSKHYGLKNRNILRVEFKIVRSRYLQKHFNIFSLGDIDRDRFRMLFNKLLEHFDELMIVDSLLNKSLDRLDQMVLFETGRNPHYWKDLRNTQSYRARKKFKKDFEGMLIDNSLLKIQRCLKSLLIQKYQELMGCDCENYKNVA